GRDPPGLGPEQTRPAQGVGQGRLLVVPRVEPEEGVGAELVRVVAASFRFVEGQVVVVRTPVCQTLGIEHPIVQAPMSAVPGLAAAVSNAGALGMLALTWSTPAGDPVRQTSALTDRPFGGNLILDSDQHRRLEDALEAGMRIGSLMWGDPAGYVEHIHDADALV